MKFRKSGDHYLIRVDEVRNWLKRSVDSAPAAA